MNSINWESPRQLRWIPIRPDLTNCNNIESVNLSLDRERGGNEWALPTLENFERGGDDLWQSAVVSMVSDDPNSGPMEELLLKVKLTFENLVAFKFFGFEPFPNSYDIRSRTDYVNLYDCRRLTRDSGYSVDPSWLDADGFSRTGAFCLWECLDSPLVDETIGHWFTQWRIEARRKLFRHFELSCDDLGTIEVVCMRAKIEVDDEQIVI